MNPVLAGLHLAAPEMVLACGGMALLLLGVFVGETSNRLVSWLAIALMIVVAGMLLIAPGERAALLSGLFVADRFAVFMKVTALAGAALAIMLSLEFNERHGMARFEYAIIAVFGTLGMMLMISANDLVSLYLGLELQSLSAYVLASFARDNLRSTEAGLKYFVLGALSSGMLLYGASLIYGFSGVTGFDALAGLFKGAHAPPTGVVIGIVFVSAGIAFKVSAVPFHMWTPDVYEGAPTPVTAFFALAPKVAAIAMFSRLLTVAFHDLIGQWQQIVWAISVGSMALGSFAALVQTNIKRLMAYSSIGHMGFALVGLAAGTAEGVRGVMIYMAIYLFMNVGTFACILMMRRGGQDVETIADLAGLSRTRPGMALLLAIFMFSMAGIPPMAGFFSKLYVFLAAIDAGLPVLAVLGVLCSVVGAYYYIRIVKLMYFDEPAPAFDGPQGGAVPAIAAGTGLVTLFFFLWPSSILAPAGRAAAALLGG